MLFSEYQKRSRVTAIYREAGDTFVYPTLGLVGEAGEVADKFKKHMRDDAITKPSELSSDQKQELAKELGDVLWYISQLTTELGLDLEDIAQTNLDKLYSRMNRDALKGRGDNR